MPSRGVAARRPHHYTCELLISAQAVFRDGATGATASVSLEAPYLAYELAYLAPPRPGSGPAAAGYDAAWIDALLLLAIVAGVVVGVYALVHQKGLCKPGEGVRIVSPHRLGTSGSADEGDPLYASLTRDQEESTELACHDRGSSVGEEQKS